MKQNKHPAVCSTAPASESRRNCLKLMSGGAIGGAALVSAPMAMAAASELDTESVSPSLLGGHKPANQRIPDITINININRHDLVDWMMIENLHEVPIILKQFAPRWVAYNNLLLDLDAMLPRQQRGRNQLEIWPNYAWNHSARGALRPLNECSGISGDCYDASRAAAAANTGARSLQLPCCVNEQGVVTLLTI